MKKYLNKSPLTVCLIMFTIGVLMGAFIAFIAQIVLSEPIAITSSAIKTDTQENREETEEEIEEKEKRE